MPKQGQSALVIPVPAAEPLLTAVSTSYPGAVREGDMGHVSLLYPFLPTADLDQEVIDWLTAFAAAQATLKVEFDAVDREPGFVSLSSSALAELTAMVRRRWPEAVPYGGRFGQNPPAHLTVAMGVADPDAIIIEELARRYLPLAATLDQMWLLTYDERWSIPHRFSFTG